MKEIQQNAAVTLNFTIKLSDGSVADSTYQTGKPAKLVIGDGSLSESFERCLLGLKAGDKRSIDLEAKDAFGAPNPDFIQYLDRAKFVGKADVEVGTIMAFSTADGSEIPGIIQQISADSVTVDFNHPLAGQNVTFEVEILSVE